MLNNINILIIDQLQWLSNRSDNPPMSWPWYQAWPTANYEWFPLSIFNGCGIQAGNACPSGHLVLSSFLETCLYSSCWDQFLRTCRVFSPPFTLNAPRYVLEFVLCCPLVVVFLYTRVFWNQTLSSVLLFGDLLIFQLLRPIFTNLPCLFSTFHLECSSVRSRVCFMLPFGCCFFVYSGLLKPEDEIHYTSRSDIVAHV